MVEHQGKECKYCKIEKQLIQMKHEISLILAILDAERLREIEKEKMEDGK